MTARARFDLRPQSVVVSGRFDLDAASELGRGLLLRPLTRVELDLSHVTEWCIFALVALVERLRGTGHQVTVVSWPRRQRR